MASLTVKELRQGVVARLKASNVEPLLSLDPGKVYDSRSNPIQAGEDVVITVETPLQRDEVLGLKPARFRMLPTMYIEVHVALERDESTPLPEIDAAEAAVRDDYVNAVKRTLMADPTWVGQFEKIVRFETNRGYDSTGSRASGLGKLTIEPQWSRTYVTDPSHYTPFESMNIKHDFAPPDGNIEHEQEIELEQPTP